MEDERDEDARQRRRRHDESVLRLVILGVAAMIFLILFATGVLRRMLG